MMKVFCNANFVCNIVKFGISRIFSPIYIIL